MNVKDIFEKDHKECVKGREFIHAYNYNDLISFGDKVAESFVDKNIESRLERGYTMAVYGTREALHEQMRGDIETLLKLRQ